MRKFLTIILIFFFFGLAQAQLQRPDLLCDTVRQDGSVVLFWNPVPDPGNIFTAYSVYYRPDPAAGFVLIGQVTDIFQGTYTHPTAGAHIRSRAYYLVAESTLGPSLPSDTLETIFLYLETDDNEHITLFWNPPYATGSPSDISYRVMREFPPGNWEELGITTALSYDHHFSFCNKEKDVARFRVITVIVNATCEYASNFSEALLSNLSQPEMPSMDSVSIDAAGKPVIGWQPATDPDIAGYIVYRVTTINDSIGFVPGMDSTFFRDLDGDPCDAALSYAIASIDSCGNKSPGTFLTPHQTLFLQDIQYDPCFMENTLDWNAYSTFDPPVAGYEVHVSVDAGPFTVLDVLGPSLTTYSHDGLLPNTTYSYFIRAFNTGRSKTSTSCTREIHTFASPYPQFMYLRYVSVQPDHRVELSFFSDTSAHVNGYTIFRSIDGLAFEEAGTIAPGSSDIFYFTDTQAEPWLQSYYYRVSVIDSCLNENFIANTSRSIWLQVISSEDLRCDLSWNAYESWDAGVEGYSVYRSTDGGSTWQEIGVTGPAELTFTDDISSFTGTGGDIGYFVEAFEGSGNQYGFDDLARSNVVTADVPVSVFVPNAMMPKGINNTLKPVGAFISGEGYLFSVYNRWGQLVFESHNPSDAWDGTFDGAYVPQGVYVYLLRFTTAAGEMVMRKGTVAVLF